MTKTLGLKGSRQGWPPEDDQDNVWQPSAEDISAFMDARIAALKAGLRLTPDQEKNWPAFEISCSGYG